MIRIKESIDSDISKYKISIYLPYYEDDSDMCYTSTTVEAESEDEARKLGQRYIKSKKTSMNSKAWKDARIDNIEKIYNESYIKANESYSIEQLADGETINDYMKDIKAYNLKISKLPDNKVKISGKKSDIIRYYDEVLGIEDMLVDIKESRVQESGFKTVFYYNDKKISAAKAKEIAGPDRLKRLVADAKEQYSEDPYVQNSYMVSGGMLTIEFV